MTQIQHDDPFLGTWELQARQSDYQLGLPPAAGLYTISHEGESYMFKIEWQTAAGQEFETTFSGIPDGQQYPYENPQIAEAISLTRVGELTLDSESFKNGVRIAHARRELIENGRVMRVTQSGRTPEGATFSNVSYYHKRD